MGKKLNWDKIGLDIKSARGNKAFCPFCQKERKNKHDRSMSIDRINGIYNCHHCGKSGHVVEFDGKDGDGFLQQDQQKKIYKKPQERLTKVSEGLIKYFESRGISNNTLLKMKIGEERHFMPTVGEQRWCMTFPYYRNEKLVNKKYRSKDKQFAMEAQCELIFYNLDSLKGEKEAIIVEGEIDALSVVESNVFNVISVPNGASKAGANKTTQTLQYIDNSFEQLKDIEKFILAVDNDEAGHNLLQELIKRFGPERCYIVHYPEGYKDFNEVLNGDAAKGLKPLGKEVVQRLTKNASPLPIAGVYYTLDVSGEMLESFHSGKPKGTTTHCPGFDPYFKWKVGNLNVITDYPNSGKTQFWLQMMLIKSMYEGWKWAVFCPENYPAEDFFDDLAEMYVGKHVDDRANNKMSEAEYIAAIEFLNEHFFYIYPEEVHDLESIHIIFSRLNLKHGLNGVLLDPWNELDHNMLAFPREDLYLSSSLKQIKRFALVNQLSYNIIAHPVKIEFPPSKDGQPQPRPVVTAYNISGGSMWWNKSDNIIIHSRPNWHIDRTSGLTKIITEKIKRKRTGGSLGDCDFMFNPMTMRYRDVSPADKVICDPARALLFKSIKQMEAQDEMVKTFKQGELNEGWKQVDTDTPPDEMPF